MLRVEEEARIARSQYDRFRHRTGAAPTVDAGPLTLWQPQVEAARAVLHKYRTTIAAAELAMSRTEVRAPFDGVVREESLDVGQFVTAGESVGRLYAYDAVEVAAPVSDGDAALIPGLWNLAAGGADPRTPARAVAEYGGARYFWEGHVDRVETALDEQTRTLEVIVRVPSPFTSGLPLAAEDGRTEAGTAGAESAPGASTRLLDFFFESGPAAGARPEPSPAPPLLLGMFVDVRIQGIAPDRYFRVRRPALRPGNELWVVRDGAVAIVPVRVLQRSNDDVYVTGALEAGEPVVVSGLSFATEDMVVRTETGAGDGP